MGRCRNTTSTLIPPCCDCKTWPQVSMSSGTVLAVCELWPDQIKDILCPFFVSFCCQMVVVNVMFLINIKPYFLIYPTYLPLSVAVIPFFKLLHYFLSLSLSSFSFSTLSILASLHPSIVFLLCFSLSIFMC